MGRNKTGHTQILSRPYVLLLLALLLAIGAADCSVAQQKTAQPASFRSRFDGYVIVNEYYDDNVFDYSGTDRSLLDSASVVPSRFAIKDIGDYVTDVALRVDRLWERGKHSSWNLRFRYDADLYGRNTFRNYHQFGTELRRETRRSFVEASFRWLPNYYLRDLYWRPMPARPLGVTYAPANFTKYSYSIEAGTRLARHLDGRTWLAIDRRDYDFPFDERDNTTYTVGARLDNRLSRRISTQVKLELGSSKAAGADSASPAVVDVSNNFREVGAELELKLDRRHNVDLSQSARYKHQTYTTGRTTDLYHFSRKDDEYEFETQLTWRPHPHWQPRAFYGYRKGTTTTAPGASDAGAYSGNRAGLQLIHYF